MSALGTLAGVAVSGAFALCALVPASARAHGGMWRANRILIAPDDPSRIVLQSDLRGPIFTRDGGASWHWICAETYGRSSISAAPVSMLLQPGGRTLVASYGRGLLVSDDDPCTFEPPPGAAPSYVRDITQSGGRLLALGSIESEQSVRDLLFAGPADASGLEPLGVPLPMEFTATSVRGVPGPVERVYVAGLHERGWAIARSDDGGQSWKLGPTNIFDSRAGWSANIVGFDTRRPDLLFVLRDELEWSLEQPSGDQLFVSEDGGASFRALFATERPLRGFATSPDGASLLIAGESGLFRAPLADALAHGQDAFVRLVNLPFYGLAWSEAGILAGMEELSSASDDAYSVGFSSDGGKTFTRRMSLCSTQAYDCAAETPSGMLCPGIFSDGHTSGGGFKEDFLESDRCVDSAPAAEAAPARALRRRPRKSTSRRVGSAGDAAL